MERVSSLQFKWNLDNYQSIAALRALVSRSDAGPNPCMRLQATVLVNLCCKVSRDIVYLEFLKEDVDAILRRAPSYHAKWADEVHTAATESLSQVNGYIATKIPATAQSSFQFQDLIPSTSKNKALDAMNDATSMAALYQQLVAAHADLVGAMALMHRLALHQASMTGEQAENRSIKSKSSEVPLKLSSAQGPESSLR